MIRSLDRLEKKLDKEYTQATKELTQRLDNYINGYDEIINGKKVHHEGIAEREARELDAKNKGLGAYGTASDPDALFKQWQINQMGRAEHWEEMRDQMAQRITEVNQIASGYINDELPRAYVVASNSVASLAKESAMEQGVTGIRFDLVDETTVRHLMREKSNNISFRTVSVDPVRDYKWNKSKIQNALTQGILQGDSITHLTDRFMRVMQNNRASAIRNARTAMTSARSAGKQDRYEDLEAQGCEITKIWVATSDDRVRDTHASADGQEVKVSEPFILDDGYGGTEELMYPCDPAGSPANVYNCRCTTKTGKIKFNSILSSADRASANIREANELNIAQDELNDLLKIQQDKTDALNAMPNSTVSGIWKNDVSLSEWESKQNSIPLKEQYYNDEKAKAIANGDSAKIAEIDAKLLELEKFNIEGEKYYNLMQAKIDADIAVKDKLKEIKLLNGYDPMLDPRSQDRKDNALWAKDTKEADKVLRGVCGDVWQHASKEERQAIYDYTGTYHPYNEPLRGIQYGLGGTAQGYKGVGNVDLNAGGRGASINYMTDIINKSSYTEDIWVQRGCRYSGMDNFFGIDMHLLQNGSTQELENALLGKEVTEYGFMSCGVAKGKGFTGNIILNVYAPAGTNMMYAEPFSQYGGSSAGLKWDGITPQSYFGSESEIILQQGTRFEITKIERVNGVIYVDMDVVGREVEQRWIP